jgi:acyl carrier protein
MYSIWSDDFDVVMRRHCRFIEPQERIDPDALMSSLGADSLEIVELIVDLEIRFRISFSEELLTPQVFATPLGIWSAVELLSQEHPIR